MSWAWDGSVAELAACDESPTTDGMLASWVRKQRPVASDVPAIIALFDKIDPHLVEAGIDLAAAALREARTGHDGGREVTRVLEPALAEVARRAHEHGSWIVEALACLLEDQPLDTVIIALAQQHVDERAPRSFPTFPTSPPMPPTPRARALFIQRNRLPEPWLRLEDLYASLALAVPGAPAARDLAYLPVLEARHGTRGWYATVEHLRLVVRR